MTIEDRIYKKVLLKQLNNVIVNAILLDFYFINDIFCIKIFDIDIDKIDYRLSNENVDYIWLDGTKFNTPLELYKMFNVEKRPSQIPETFELNKRLYKICKDFYDNLR